MFLWNCVETQHQRLCTFLFDFAPLYWNFIASNHFNPFPMHQFSIHSNGLTQTHFRTYDMMHMEMFW